MKSSGGNSGHSRTRAAWAMVLAWSIGWIATPAFAEDRDLVWARSMSGTDEGSGFGIALDAAGNVLTTGSFAGTVDFDPGPGSFNLTSGGSRDIFIQKLDQSGDLMWAWSVGGTGRDVGRAVAVDSTGNVYITGSFSGTVDFDPGPATFDLTSAGSDDIFVQKLDADGNFLWARSMGGGGPDVGLGIAVDHAGNVYTTGSFGGAVDFDPGPDSFILNGGFADIFLQKLDADGNFLWARAIGGGMFDAEPDVGTGIAVDEAGHIYTTGTFTGTVDFDPGPGTFNLTAVGLDDIFVQKLDPNGDLIWARTMGGTGFDRSHDIVVDDAGNVYLTGAFEDTADFDPGPGTFNLTSAGFYDIFVQKLDTDGDLVWARAMGGAGFNMGNGIAVDGAGNVFTTGRFHGTVDFDPGLGTFNLTSAGLDDIFVHKLDSDGDLVWAGVFGSAQQDTGQAIAVDATGSVHLTGSFKGEVDFDPGPGSFPLIAAGDSDIFVLKLSGHIVPGDVNGDGVVNAVDVQLVINAALGIAIDPAFQPDINGDGLVNAVDVQLVINAALGISINP